jgi:hypothetical protein
MLDQSNLSTQRCRLIFGVECSVGGYLVLAKTIEICVYVHILPEVRRKVYFWFFVHLSVQI